MYTQRQKKVPTSENVHISESISVTEFFFLKYTSPLVNHQMHYNNTTFTKTVLQNIGFDNKQKTKEIAKR